MVEVYLIKLRIIKGGVIMSKAVRYRIAIQATLSPEEYVKVREALEADYVVGYLEGEATVNGGYKTWDEIWEALNQFKDVGKFKCCKLSFSGVGYNVPEGTAAEEN